MGSARIDPCVDVSTWVAQHLSRLALCQGRLSAALRATLQRCGDKVKELDATQGQSRIWRASFQPSPQDTHLGDSVTASDGVAATVVTLSLVVAFGIICEMPGQLGCLLATRSNVLPLLGHSSSSDLDESSLDAHLLVAEACFRLCCTRQCSARDALRRELWCISALAVPDHTFSARSRRHRQQRGHKQHPLNTPRKLQ